MDNKFTTPVLLIAFNRLHTVAKLYEVLKKVKPPRLYVAIDAPRKTIAEEAEKVSSVKNFILNNVDWPCEIKTKFWDINVGTKYAPSGAIQWFFSNEEMGIVLEDDCLPNEDFFYYCQELLKHYKNDSRIGMISGLNRFDHYPCENSYHLATGGSIWGWASWGRVGSNFNPDNPLFKSKYLRKYLSDSINDPAEVDHICSAIIDVLDNRFKTWDLPWGTLLKINSQLSIVPAKNMVLNIGVGPEATHFDTKDVVYTKMKYNKFEYPIKHPECIVPDLAFSKLQASPHLPSMPIRLLRRIAIGRKMLRYISDNIPKSVRLFIRNFKQNILWRAK